MNLRTLVAVTVVTASLGVGALAVAPAAGAETTQPTAQVCQRAHDVWERLVAANQKLVERYHELRAREAELLANGHVNAAHRLDTRLDIARRRHERIAKRVLAIAAKVKDRCTEEAPALEQL